MAFKYNADAQQKISPDGESFLNIPKEKLFIPQAGQYKLRILPPWSPQGLFAKYARIHWGVGSSLMRTVCPDMLVQGSCPFCVSYHQMRSDFNTFKEDIQVVRPIDRFYTNTYNLGEPQRGVIIWSFGKIIYRLIKGIQDSGDFGDITDEENGSDLTLTRTGQGRNVQDTIYPVRQPSKLANPTLVDSLFDLDTILKDPDIDELMAAWETQPWKVFEPKGKAPVRSMPSPMAKFTTPIVPVSSPALPKAEEVQEQQPVDRFTQLKDLENKIKQQKEKALNG